MPERVCETPTITAGAPPGVPEIIDIRDVTFESLIPIPAAPPRVRSVAVVGLGYVGLPTALGLFDAGLDVHGLDISAARIAAIYKRSVDLISEDHERLRRALENDTFDIGVQPDALGHADAVIITVPTPVDRHLTPDLRALTAACQSVVDRARPGQLILLTSTSYAGTTRDLLVNPLREKGFRIGEDLWVAFSPERIDPGVPQHTQRSTPRVVGGETPACTERARELLALLTDSVHEVRSPEAAELTKLYENTFRAVTLALANEFAEICGTLQLDPVEITQAAATKPYGFLALYPGPGVGGHCIPCDPHYLLWQLRRERRSAPLTEQALASIARRPRVVVDRAAEVLSDDGIGLRGARVLVVGVSYKPGVQDLRESSALEIIAELQKRGAVVAYHDPLIPTLTLPCGSQLHDQREPHQCEWDLVLMQTLHPGIDYGWAARQPRVLDGTYRFNTAGHRVLV